MFALHSTSEAECYKGKSIEVDFGERSVKSLKQIIQEYTSTAVGLVGTMCFLWGLGTLFFSDTGLFAMLVKAVVGGIR